MLYYYQTFTMKLFSVFVKAAIILALLIVLPVSAATTTQSKPPTVSFYDQQAQVFITWHANTYIPPEYAGKALPSANSKVQAFAEVVDHGKIVDLSKLTVFWYLNNNFIAGGVGATSASFRAGEALSDKLSLRAEVQGYKAITLIQTVTIPVVLPSVVINGPYPTDQTFESELRLRALPYYFNVTDPLQISLGWKVNDEPPLNVEDPEILTVQIPSDIPGGFGINVSLLAKNVNDPLSFARDSKTFTYLK